MRNPLVEMPKNLNKNCPQKVKPNNIKKEVIVARFIIRLRSTSLKPLVMVRNTGIVPKGLVKVKKEVKHNSAKGSIVSIVNNYIFCKCTKKEYNKKASDIFLYRRLQLKRRLPTLPQTQYHRRDKA